MADALVASQQVGFFPEAGTEPLSPTLAEQILNHWIAREAPRYVVIKYLSFSFHIKKMERKLGKVE